MKTKSKPVWMVVKSRIASLTTTYLVRLPHSGADKGVSIMVTNRWDIMMAAERLESLA